MTNTKIATFLLAISFLQLSALAQTASHVTTAINGDQYHYTIFNDESTTSSRFLSVFTIYCHAPFIVIGTPPGWEVETNGYTYVTWADADDAFPYPHEIAPGTFLGGFAIMSLTGVPTDQEYEAFSWDHSTNGQGPNAAGALVGPAIGQFPPCAADLDFDGDFDNGGTPDGGVTIEDLLYFLAAYALGDGGSDLDDGSSTGTPDGGVTIDDLLYYLQRFEVGC